MVISGNLGPRGDGYVAAVRMSAEQARDYHQEPIDTFARTAADMVSVFTMNYVDEAIGIALAARSADIPVAISFTVETNGQLPSGETLAQAIERTDTQTAGYPAYYMLNCAHPEHLEHLFQDTQPWHERVRGRRAARMSPPVAAPGLNEVSGGRGGAQGSWSPRPLIR